MLPLNLKDSTFFIVFAPRSSCLTKQRRKNPHEINKSKLKLMRPGFNSSLPAVTWNMKPPLSGIHSSVSKIKNLDQYVYVTSNFDSPCLYHLNEYIWVCPFVNYWFTHRRIWMHPIFLDNWSLLWEILNSVQNFFAVAHNLFLLPVCQGWSLFSGKNLETYEGMTKEIGHLQFLPCFWSWGSKFKFRPCLGKVATMYF